MNRSTSSNELYRCDLEGIECHTDYHELAVRPQAVEQLGHGFRAWSCRQNHLGAAQFSQLLCRIRRFAVDIHARPKFLREGPSFRPAPDRCDVITKLVRE